MTLGYPSVYRAPDRGFASRVFGRGSLLRRLDWVLLVTVGALCAIGSLLVWSATRADDSLTGGDPEAYLKRQLINIAIASIAALAVARYDYRTLRAATPLVYAASLLGLLAVFTPLGQTINGSHSWLVVGGMSLQPSELAKIGIVLVMAMLLGERTDREDRPRDADVLVALGLATVPVAMVLLQPDLGTVMVMGSIVLGLLLVSGASDRWLAGLAIAGMVVALVVAQMGLLSEYQVNRFAAFADPSLDPQGAGYNANQARIAIGSGGLTGKGLFEGSQTSGQFVPEQHTDFVFTVAGEELGFAGSALIVLLFAVLLWRAFLIAFRAPDLFGRLVAAGVATWFGFQIFENIGMTVGIMPITGLPLPLVSYGGSSMFASLLAVGLLQSIHAHGAD